MRTPALALVALLMLITGAFAAPQAIPGPLGRESGHFRATASLGLTMLPKSTEDPVSVVGNPIPVVIEGKVSPSKVAGHAFEISVVVVGQKADGTADPSKVYIRCGTVVADKAHPVPGTAISVVQQGVGKKKEITPTSWATYSVAKSKGVNGVGVVNFEDMMEAAKSGGTMKQIAVPTFSLGLAQGGKVRFFSETVPFQDGTLVMAVEAASWEYVKK